MVKRPVWVSGIGICFRTVRSSVVKTVTVPKPRRIPLTQTGLLLLALLSAPAFGANETPPPSAAAMAKAAATPVPDHLSFPRGWSFKVAGLIPVQNGGRLKPLDSFAREAVLFVTGSRTYRDFEPLELLIAWVSNPEEWRLRPVIRISRADVKRQLGLDEKLSLFSPNELLHNFALAQYAQEAMGKAEQQSSGPQGSMMTQKQDEREKELRAAMERLSLFQNVVTGDAWVLIPRKKAPKNSVGAWDSVRSSGPEGETIRNGFLGMLHAYIDGDEAGFQRQSQLTRSAVEGEIPDFTDAARKTLEVESLYDRLHPFQLAWVLYLLAALTLVVSFAVPKKIIARLGMLLVAGGFAFHVFGFALRCYVAGRPPVTNMYESVIWVSMGVVVFATVLYWIQGNRVTLAVASVLATLGLILADAAPAMLDPSIKPLVPVLRSNYWLTIHVLTITLGYAALALTAGIANVALFFHTRNDDASRTRAAGLNLLTYRSMQFGVVLLAAGTILGGIWADYSWGRFWGWDPKEVWALIALLSYVTILHGRYAAWVGQFGFTAWTIIAFMSVLMAWYGVNFILGVGLHSYGFSSGGFTGVATFVSLQISYVVLIAVLRSRARAHGPTAFAPSAAG